MYVLFALLIIYQKHRIDFFTTYIQQRRGAIFFRLTTTDMSFEIHTTTVVEKDIYIYITLANGGTYAGKYLRDGWVRNLDLTQFIYTTYSLFSDSGKQSVENH